MKVVHKWWILSWVKDPKKLQPTQKVKDRNIPYISGQSCISDRMHSIKLLQSDNLSQY